ncbi:hypothetical protein SDC9_172345 [bioreactor metagenome]|uniref:Uncharacterized protein n=1 Tax=bioreactor metagenome TaxID=1076179 RepID=A0A645GGM3_9ZZZZ
MHQYQRVQHGAEHGQKLGGGQFSAELIGEPSKADPANEVHYNIRRAVFLKAVQRGHDAANAGERCQNARFA